MNGAVGASAPERVVCIGAFMMLDVDGGGLVVGWW
jgi:hypothetical protein